MFTSETRFYRSVLGISWEFGSHLRKTGVLCPDAVLDGEQALYLLTPEKLEAARTAVFLPKPANLKPNPLEPATMSKSRFSISRFSR
jgi:hypothetical protein